MPSPPPAAKRRRVDSLGIHKPFVSPLKRSPSSPATTDQAPTTTTTTTPKPSARVAAPQATPTTPYTPLRSSNLKPSTSASHQPAQDPEVVQAHQSLRALDSQIRSLRNQNAILQQALDISTSTSTPRLVSLEEKWRKASQQAAEEVFCSFSQSIRDNGGYTVFLKQQQQQQNNNSQNFFGDEREEVDGTNEEDWRDEDGDCLTERGKRQRREDIEDRAKKQQTVEEQEEEEEEQELTLGSMLQVLNIPPEVIGWDSKTQAWK
ncbi:hypothetical protein QM012_000981 [Aureobasidium pullulans]|uniref:Swi5-dependent recombination DNA repair protein 1 n=1 Tax=Aureobasidium pullulans TaxID=5580 RepID=A0ABR0TFC3_AURPU